MDSSSEKGKSSRTLNSTNMKNIGRNENKTRESLTKLKLLFNEMETNYSALLKNLSKKILKPSGLIRRHDPNMLVNKIK